MASEGYFWEIEEGGGKKLSRLPVSIGQVECVKCLPILPPELVQ
jgi:hypothetical protein